MTGAFSGNPDSLLDKVINKIREIQEFDLREVFGVIREDGRSLEVSKDTILDLKYHNKEIHMLFNLWYGFNYEPSLNDNKPEVDHIFPQSELRKIKIPNPETGKMNLMKYKWQERDQIGNLMLLTSAENGAGNKTNILPEEWFADKIG